MTKKEALKCINKPVLVKPWGIASSSYKGILLEIREPMSKGGPWRGLIEVMEMVRYPHKSRYMPEYKDLMETGGVNVVPLEEDLECTEDAYNRSLQTAERND
jgi:hypothetical protein